MLIPELFELFFLSYGMAEFLFGSKMSRNIIFGMVQINPENNNSNQVNILLLKISVYYVFGFVWMDENPIFYKTYQLINYLIYKLWKMTTINFKLPVTDKSKTAVCGK